MSVEPMSGAADFLASIGVRPLSPATSPFDPGYDPVTLEAHLAQSAHLIDVLKLSMACWLVADEAATREKLESAKRHHIRTTTGGGPFEIAAAQGELERYLDVCAGVGFDRIECGEGFTHLTQSPDAVCGLARDRGLEVQFELGEKHGGSFDEDVVDRLIELGRRWIGAGAVQLVIEGRENARAVGLFDGTGTFDARLAERFVDAFGMHTVVFEAPVKASQFALLDHFGPEVHLSNVRLEEILRVEIYRRGLHSDAFLNERLRPGKPK